MAEILLLAIAAGGTFLITNQSKRKLAEGYQNQHELPNTNIPDSNYPSQKRKTIEDESSSLATNNRFETDEEDLIAKYYSPQNNSINGVSFGHNNQVPFYKGQSKQPDNLSETMFDNYSGAGSQHISKSAIKPMFADQQEQNKFLNGMPNLSDYYQSRAEDSVSGIQQNVQSFKPIRDVPMDSDFYDGREEKTVDELRMGQSKADSYSLHGFEGHACAHNKSAATIDQLGEYHTNGIERVFEQGPEMYLTTTGLVIAPTSRATMILSDTERETTENHSYAGIATNNDPAMRMEPGDYDQSTRQLLAPNLLGVSSSSQKFATGRDYGHESHFSNNRVANYEETRYGLAGSIVSGLVAPILDFLRPTKKEKLLANMHIYGNMEGHVKRPGVFDMNAPQTTIKETTQNLETSQFVDRDLKGGGNGYLVAGVQAHEDHTIESEYYGASLTNNSKGMTDYASSYNHTPHGLKELGSLTVRPTVGGRDLGYNSQQGIHKNTYKDYDVHNTRTQISDIRCALPPSISNTQQQSTSAKYEYTPYDRNEPDMLEGFKSNPYTITRQF